MKNTKTYKNNNSSIDVAKEIVNLTIDDTSKAPTLNAMLEESPEMIEELIQRLEDKSRRENIMDIRDNSIKNNHTLNIIKTVNNLNKKKRMKYRARLAASVVAAAVFAISFLLTIHVIKRDRLEVENSYVAEYSRIETISYPTLITESGTYELSDAKQIEDDGVEVYPNISEKAISDNDIKMLESQINRIVMPKGFTYQVKLADGTLITLNAGSELQYPTSFEGKDKRAVTLKGEAYFDVAKSEIPFVVTSEGVDVKVYGTEFNVNSHYSGRVETVLIEGSVGVSKNGVDEVMILPNQVASFDLKREVAVISDVDNLDQYISWVNNDFIYRNKPLYEVAHDISNWYGVDILLPQELKEIKVSFYAKRSNSLEYIINVIESAINVEFTNKEGRYIIEK